MKNEKLVSRGAQLSKQASKAFKVDRKGMQEFGINYHKFHDSFNTQLINNHRRGLVRVTFHLIARRSLIIVSVENYFDDHLLFSINDYFIIIQVTATSLTGCDHRFVQRRISGVHAVMSVGRSR